MDKVKNPMKEIIDTVVYEFDKNCSTLNELSIKWGYTDRSYLSRKARKLGLGCKVKTLVLLTKDEEEILKKSIKRRVSKFSSQQAKPFSL